MIFDWEIHLLLLVNPCRLLGSGWLRVVQVVATEAAVVLRVLVRQVLPGNLLAVPPVAVSVWLPRVAGTYGSP